MLGDDVRIFVEEFDVALEGEVPSVSVAHGSDAVEHLQNVIGRQLRRRLNVFANHVARLSELRGEWAGTSEGYWLYWL